MHFAFVAKCRYPSGDLCHLAWQRSASTRAEAKKILLESCKNGIAYHLVNGGEVKLEELIDFGECEGIFEETLNLYEKAEVKACKLNSQQRGK